MSTYIQPVHGLRQDKALAGTLPAPSAATDGVDVTKWRPFSGMGYTKCVVTLIGDAAVTVTSGVLYGYGPYGIGGAFVWSAIGQLNSGASISLTATAGYAEDVDLPSIFDRLAVGGTVAGGNAGYTVTPLAEVE